MKLIVNLEGTASQVYGLGDGAVGVTKSQRVHRYVDNFDESLIDERDADASKVDVETEARYILLCDSLERFSTAGYSVLA